MQARQGRRGMRGESSCAVVNRARLVTLAEITKRNLNTPPPHQNETPSASDFLSEFFDQWSYQGIVRRAEDGRVGSDPARIRTEQAKRKRPAEATHPIWE